VKELCATTLIMNYGNFNKRFDENDWYDPDSRWRLVDPKGKEGITVLGEEPPIKYPTTEKMKYLENSIIIDREAMAIEELEASKKDNVNSPTHYKQGKSEAIDIIEDAIKGAPDPTLGLLHGQILKYLLRLWHKDNSREDASKARWYLNRLIEKL